MPTKCGTITGSYNDGMISKICCPREAENESNLNYRMYAYILETLAMFSMVMGSNDKYFIIFSTISLILNIEEGLDPSRFSFCSVFCFFIGLQRTSSNTPLELMSSLCLLLIFTVKILKPVAQLPKISRVQMSS
jgi:hypothetical protein